MWVLRSQLKPEVIPASTSSCMMLLLLVLLGRGLARVVGPPADGHGSHTWLFTG